jgi:Trypsin-like peptidase domain
VGQGSGFIVDPSGVIATNFHMIAGANHVEVKLENGEIFDAVGVVAFDARRDVALIKIRKTKLPVLHFGNPELLRQGQHIVSIGNPMGLERTLSEGIISAIRVVEGTRYLQISAPSSPGSSGGPVMDLQGQVVGIVTKGIVGQGAQNLNFAVPVDYVEPLLGQEAKYAFADLAREYAPARPGEQPTLPGPAPKDSEVQDFIVWHDHGDGFLSYCMGVLSVSGTSIAFRATQSPHSFETPLDGIDEVRKNDVYASDRDAFHIRLKNGDNFNFAYAPSGQAVASDPVLSAIYKMMNRTQRS